MRSERGASAVLVAGSLLLLFGVAAVAVDLGAVYAEDRQAQTAADLAVMAGVIEYAGNTAGSSTRDEVLDFVRDNLTATYTEAAWETAWATCTDPGKPGNFLPVDAPAAWAATTIDCISGSDDELRVKVPDQLVEAFFGSTLGVESIPTRAVAQAELVLRKGAGGVRPFGLVDGLPAGSVCLTTSSSPAPPCDGPSQGAFGTLNSQTWGSDKSVTDCGNPGGDELAQNIAQGVDHPIGLAPPFAGSGSSYGAYPAGITRDDVCTVSGGEAVAADNSPRLGPVNTMRADTGFSQFHSVKNGLLSGVDGFPNATGSPVPLLQQTVGGLGTITLKEKDQGSQYSYVVDNTPLWHYLLDSHPVGACNKATVVGAGDYAAQQAAMDACLAAYETTGASSPIFSDTIAENPRFGWAPQFHFTTWGPGSSGWQPVARYRMIYIDTIWFNCNNQYDDLANSATCGGGNDGNGLIFPPGYHPDGSQQSRGNGNSLKKLRVDQVSAFLMPKGAIPKSIAGSFPGQELPFELRLTR